MPSQSGSGAAIAATIVFLLGLIVAGGSCYVIPKYRVWSQGMAGEAALKRAEQEKKILIEQARAEVDAAKLRAEAIEVVGEATQKYPEYRLQEFLGAFGEALKEGNVQQIVYVPTEANIPILEARRLTNQ